LNVASSPEHFDRSSHSHVDPHFLKPMIETLGTFEQFADSFHDFRPLDWQLNIIEVDRLQKASRASTVE